MAPWRWSVKQNIAELLEQALAATARHDWNTRAHLAQELASQPEDLFEALPEILGARSTELQSITVEAFLRATDVSSVGYISKGLHAIASKAFYMVGYPINERAIPFLLCAISDANIPGAAYAFWALQAAPFEAIIPYVIDVFWDRERPPAWRKEMLLTVSDLLMDFEDQNLDPVGPTVAYLLGSSEEFEERVTQALLAVLQAIGAPSAHYAIPTLVALVERSPNDMIRTRAKHLLDSYSDDERAPYRRILPDVSRQEPIGETPTDSR